jgi:hypothetical protein
MQSRLAMTAVLCLVVVVAGSLFVFLGPLKQKEDKSALLKALSKAKISLAEGIKQVTKPPESAISAKFEMDDKGQLVLSIYTAEKGLGVAADQNVLKEISGSAESESWNPQGEAIKDPSDLSDAKTQLGIMSGANCSLLDVIEKAEAKGTVISVIPVTRRGKSFFDVDVVSKGRKTGLAFDLAGKQISGEDEDDDDDD